MSKVAKVRRPWNSKDENGNTKENPGWTDIGFAHPPKNGGKGWNLFLNFQPLVNNGKVETIYLYDFEKKQETSNVQPI